MDALEAWGKVSGAAFDAATEALELSKPQDPIAMARVALARGDLLVARAQQMGAMPPPARLTPDQQVAFKDMAGQGARNQALHAAELWRDGAARLRSKGVEGWPLVLGSESERAIANIPDATKLMALPGAGKRKREDKAVAPDVDKAAEKLQDELKACDGLQGEPRALAERIEASVRWAADEDKAAYYRDALVLAEGLGEALQSRCATEDG